MKKIFAFAVGMVLLLSVGFGLITKASFKDGFSDGNFEDYQYTPYELTGINVQNVFDNLDSAALIAKVYATGQQEQAYLCTRSTVEVMNVYKGDVQLENTKINVFELAYFGPYFHDCRNFGCFNLMQPEQEYIVFLYEKNYLPSYQATLPLKEYRALGEFSILPVNTAVLRYFPAEKAVKYRDLNSERILVSSEDNYQIVVKTIREILDHYEVAESSTLASQ
jgi:hypothetical protein